MVAALPDVFEALGKRIRKKIWKVRKDMTPNTETSHHGSIGDMAEKKHSAAMQGMEDVVSSNDSDFETPRICWITL